MRIAKKAQLSWFVVMGLVFLIIIGIISWLAYSTQFMKKPSQILASEDMLSQVKVYLESCEKEIAEEALILIGNQGGKISPENYFKINNNKVSYELPSLEDISKDMANYIDKNLRNCKAETITKKKVEISKPRTSIRFNDKETIVDVNWPTTLILENNTKHSIDSIKFSLPVRMKLIHETVQGLSSETNLNFVDSLDSMDLKKVGYDDRVLGILVDHKSRIRDKPYKFFFVK